MINLLPPEVKESYRYGLRNSSLLHWVAACIAGLAGLGLLATYGLVTLQHSSTSYTQQVAASTTTLARENLSGTEKQVKDISTNLKLVVQVLSKEILFSQLLKQIATVIPSNAILKGLDISQTTGAIDITAAASNYQAATQLQVNLQDPRNKIFSKADIVSITCSTDPDTPQYPCTAQLRALFAADNPYLFINSKGTE